MRLTCASAGHPLMLPPFTPLREENVMSLEVGGQWDAIQDNGFVARVDIRQDGDQIDGGDRCSYEVSTGTVRSVAAKGHVQNDYFEFLVTWNNATERRYTGFIRRSGPDTGFITGDTEDSMHPGNHSGWKSSRNFPFPVWHL